MSIMNILFLTVSELFWCVFFETFKNLFGILLPIKSVVAPAGFWIRLLKTVSNHMLQIVLHDQEVFDYINH